MSEKLARQFHEVYERLAPKFGYETRTETRNFDPTSSNGKLMIAVCDEVVGPINTSLDTTRGELNQMRDAFGVLQNDFNMRKGRRTETNLDMARMLLRDCRKLLQDRSASLCANIDTFLGD